MTPDQLTAAWKLLRATDNSFISPLEVAQLKDWLRVSLKAVEAQQAALANEREQCCKDTCLYCAKDYPIFLAPNAMDANAPKQWAHKVPGSTFAKYCHAYAIRQRATKENPAATDQGSESEVK